MDIQTEIGNPIQELYFQNESTEKRRVDFSRFENIPKCAPSPGSVNPTSCIIQLSRERTTAIVHTRIHYPNPKSPRLTKEFHVFSLCYFVQKARISHSPMYRSLEKKEIKVVNFSISKKKKKNCKETLLINETRFW